MSDNPWGSDSIDIEWREFELELYEEHCDVMNVYLQQYEDGRYRNENYHSFGKVLSKQNGGDYHGWLVILGAMLSHEKAGGWDFEHVEIEKNICRRHPDLLCHDSRTIVEAGSPGVSTLEDRAKGLLWNMLNSKDFAARHLNQWKFLNIPKDVFVKEEFEKSSEFVLTDNPVCRLIKPKNIRLDLDKSGMGFWMPGWGNISEDRKARKYDSDHYTNKSFF